VGRRSWNGAAGSFQKETANWRKISREIAQKSAFMLIESTRLYSHSIFLLLNG
jgi:hypothetical protein